MLKVLGLRNSSQILTICLSHGPREKRVVEGGIRMGALIMILGVQP